MKAIYKSAILLCLLLLAALPETASARTRFLPIRLPADARVHPGAHNEWWYFTGHLRDAAGHRYGFELTTFKFGDVRAISPLFPYDTLYRIDLAITDEASATFSSMVDYLTPRKGKTVLSSSTLLARMPGTKGTVALDTLPGPGLAYRLRGTMSGGQLDLQARTARPPLLEGVNGVETIADGYSYYYSLTNLQTTGTLTLHGHAFAVSGLTWMDHQWGDWDWTLDKGWDWMAIQLPNGTSLALVNFTSKRGDNSKYATVSFANGAHLFTPGARMIPLGRTWTSPRTGTRYPAAWRVQVPAIGLDAVVTPTVPNQEMIDSAGLVSSYWEGSCTLVGTLNGRPVTAETYTELVGYGKKGLAGF